jgi:methylmalonyl-CoA mutase C-terminal domain/subunit
VDIDEGVLAIYEEFHANWPSSNKLHAVTTTATARKIRVVVAKPGLDGHDRGAKIIARALRDAGMEVIYTGLHQTPEQIAETVIQEDADAVGLSILSGAHMTLVPRVVALLEAQGVDDVLVTVGGTIPADDIPELKRLGVAEVFTPGAGTDEIVDFIRTGATERHERGE